LDLVFVLRDVGSGLGQVVVTYNLRSVGIVLGVCVAAEWSSLQRKLRFYVASWYRVSCPKQV
jgi:hypothetical protein